MAEEQQNEAAAGGSEQQQQAQLTVQHVFLKDCSFEAPGALGMNQAQGQPDMNLNLSQRVNDLGENRLEIVLTVTVTAKQGDQTAFLAEVHYSGIFQFAGFSEQQMPYVVNVLCPNVLFPYARSQAANLISAGGFYAPPLQPINFEAIFAQRMAEQQKKQAGDGAGNGAGDGAGDDAGDEQSSVN